MNLPSRVPLCRGPGAPGVFPPPPQQQSRGTEEGQPVPPFWSYVDADCPSGGLHSFAAWGHPVYRTLSPRACGKGTENIPESRGSGSRASLHIGSFQLLRIKFFIFIISWLFKLRKVSINFHRLHLMHKTTVLLRRQGSSLRHTAFLWP